MDLGSMPRRLNCIRIMPLNFILFYFFIYLFFFLFLAITYIPLVLEGHS